MSFLFGPGMETLKDSHGEYVLRKGEVTAIDQLNNRGFYWVTVFLGATPGEEWLGHVRAYGHTLPLDPVGLLATVRIYTLGDQRYLVDRVMKWERPVYPSVWERLERG